MPEEEGTPAPDSYDPGFLLSLIFFLDLEGDDRIGLYHGGLSLA